MEKEKVLHVATVCFPVRGNEILLARKTRSIGAGCWNGYGGGPEEGDKGLRATAVRELYEECGLLAHPKDLTKIAIMDFHNTTMDDTVFVARVHFYALSSWSGECHESSEMANPTWFCKDKLPLDEMMPADRVFLPVALGGKKIIGSAHYGPYQKKLIGDVLIREVREFLEE